MFPKSKQTTNKQKQNKIINNIKESSKNKTNKNNKSKTKSKTKAIRTD